MVDAISRIITNVLTAFYQTFWFSILTSILFMFLYLYVKDRGWRNVLRCWIISFKTSSKFRRIFIFVFFTVMILMRTLLNRYVWMTPLSNIMGGWSLIDAEGNLTTEPIENTLLMIPFTSLLLCAFREKLIEKKRMLESVLLGLRFGFCFSFVIESLELFFRLGTVQLADLFFNSFGGAIGGFIYYIYTDSFITYTLNLTGRNSIRTRMRNGIM